MSSCNTTLEARRMATLNVTKLDSFTGSARVLGQTRWVQFDGGALSIRILGLADANEILRVLSEHGIERDAIKVADPVMVDAPAVEPPQAVAPAPTPERVRKVPKKAAEAKPAPAPEPVEFEPEAEDGEPEAESNGADGADYSVFSRITKLSDVVAELKRRGHTDYPAILTECQKIKGMEISVPLSRIADLPSRLKVQCSSQGITDVPL